MIERLIESKNNIKALLEKSDDFIETITSEELFQIIMAFSKDDDIRPLIEKKSDEILRRCTTDYDMFNSFTVICMNASKINKEKAITFIEEELKKNFGKDSFSYLLKLVIMMQKEGAKSKDELFKIIINDLSKMSTDKSSKILFDLYLFPDFNLYLNTDYRVVATIIEAYQNYAPDILSSQIINGSTIIGKLLTGNNQLIVAKHLRDLLKEKQISTRYIKMVGGGGSCLVFKIGDMVIKLGESRNDRKIFINHRILASYLRKLELNEKGEELFWVEIMKYAIVGDVTPAERDELKQDLYEQGLIWDDDKLINCGVLVDGDENYYDREIDYSVVAGHINYPERREAFMKRKRRVVVIDNDHIRFNSLKSCR